jgi:hypothetical protein
MVDRAETTMQDRQSVLAAALIDDKRVSPMSNLVPIALNGAIILETC